MKRASLSAFYRRVLYEFMYWRGRPRWDTGITPPELKQLIEVEHLPPGRALDIGCGTGTNVVYLAQHGFEVVGIDLIERAVRKAREKVRMAGAAAELRVANVLEPMDFAAPFDLVLDIGCFHNFDSAGRALYAGNVKRWTRGGSLMLLYAFFPFTMGTRRFGVTPEAVEASFAPNFKLASSTVGEKGSGQDSAWYRLVRVERNERNWR